MAIMVLLYSFPQKPTYFFYISPAWQFSHWSLITSGSFRPARFSLKSLTPLYFTPAHSPLSQEMICFLYHQGNNLLGMISTPSFSPIYKHICLPPQAPPSAFCKRNTCSSYVRPALPPRLWIFLPQICRHLVSNIHFFPVSSILTLPLTPFLLHPNPFKILAV